MVSDPDFIICPFLFNCNGIEVTLILKFKTSKKKKKQS